MPKVLPFIINEQILPVLVMIILIIIYDKLITPRQMALVHTLLAGRNNEIFKVKFSLIRYLVLKYWVKSDWRQAEWGMATYWMLITAKICRFIYAWGLLVDANILYSIFANERCGTLFSYWLDVQILLNLVIFKFSKRPEDCAVRNPQLARVNFFASQADKD